MQWKRLNIMSCCGSSSWLLDSSAGDSSPLMITGDESPAALETLNLAMALAVERRKMNMGRTDGVVVKPLKSVVRLFEVEERDVEAAEDGGGVMGGLCSLCKDRYKGAALVPCGHTYCRVCCGEMCSKKEVCPLCKCLIMEILEIF